MLRHTSSRNQRSWVTTSSAPDFLGQRLLRCSASHAIAVDVEVVGGLVEHEHVAVLDQHAGEVHAAPLAAGERADAGVPGEVGDQAAA